jgi:hypothetical protein
MRKPTQLSHNKILINEKYIQQDPTSLINLQDDKMQMHVLLCYVDMIYHLFPPIYESNSVNEWMKMRNNRCVNFVCFSFSFFVFVFQQILHNYSSHFRSNLHFFILNSFASQLPPTLTPHSSSHLWVKLSQHRIQLIHFLLLNKINLFEWDLLIIKMTWQW